MITQGSNLPLYFSNIPISLDSIADISAGLYTREGKELKHWGKDELTIVENGILAPITQAESMGLPVGFCYVELKFTDNSGMILPGIRVMEHVSRRDDKTELSGEQPQTLRYVDIDCSNVLADVGAVVGASAYELAIKYGFTGTVEEWLESLRYDHSEEFTAFVNQIMENTQTAQTAAQTSVNAANTAGNAANTALEAKDATQRSETNAAESEKAASYSAAEANKSETAAAQLEAHAASSAKAAESAKNEAVSARGAAELAAGHASASEANAKASEEAATKASADAVAAKEEIQASANQIGKNATDIGELKSDLVELDSRLYESIIDISKGKSYLPIEFVRGTHTSEGTVNTSVHYCSVTNGKVQFNKDTTLSVADGYVIFVRWFPVGGGSSIKSKGWVNTVDVAKDDVIMLAIRKDPENIQDDAKPSYGKFVTYPSDVMDGIKQNEKRISAIGDTVISSNEKLEHFEKLFSRSDKYNLYNFNDETKVVGKYVYDIYKDGKHQIAVASADNYSYSKVENVSGGEYVFSCWSGLGSDKVCVFAFDADNNYLGKITGEVKDSIYSTNVYVSIILPVGTSWIYVNNSAVDGGDIYHYIGSRYMFLKGNLFPNEFIPYKDVYNLSDSVKIPKLEEIDETVESNSARITILENKPSSNNNMDICASERESFFDVVKRLPFSAREYAKLHDGAERYSDNQYTTYGTIDGQNVVTVSLPSGVSTSLVHNFSQKTCYKNFVYSVYIENVENVQEISVKAVTLGTGGGNYTISRSANLLKNGWNHINQTGFVVGTPNAENITRIEVKIISKSDGAIKVSIGDIHSYSRKAMCTIWFDDQHDTVYSKAFPLMKNRNIEGTMSVIAGSVNDVSGHFMTKSQLFELWANGWDLCNHTWYTDSLTNYSTEQATYSIARGKELLKNIGVGNASNYLVLPQGDINTEIEESAKKYCTMIRYAGSVKQSIRYCMMPYDDWYHVPCYSVKNTMSVDDVKNLIDEAVEVGSWITLLYHGFVDGTPTVQTLWNIDDFETILDYLQTKDIDVVTASDAVMKQ